MSRHKETKRTGERRGKDRSRDLHDFGAAAYAAALRFYNEHHHSPRALARYMRRLEA